MYKVAICDDDSNVRAKLKGFIGNYFSDIGENCEVFLYDDGARIIEAMHKGSNYDLIFLDIEMTELDGVSVGTIIRNTFNNQAVDISYISSVKKHAIELFESRPINFLIKPLEYEAISGVIKKSMYLNKKGEEYYDFKINTSSFRVPIKDILFFASRGRKITMKTKLDTYEFYGKISDVHFKLIDFDFMLIHKSHLVNYLHVKEFKYDSLTMINNEMLSISQNYRNAVKLKQLARGGKQWV